MASLATILMMGFLQSIMAYETCAAATSSSALTVASLILSLLLGSSGSVYRAKLLPYVAASGRKALTNSSTLVTTRMSSSSLSPSVLGIEFDVEVVQDVEVSDVEVSDVENRPADATQTAIRYGFTRIK